MQGEDGDYFTDPDANAWVFVEAWDWYSHHTIEDLIEWWGSPEMMADWMPEGQVLDMKTVDDTSGAVVYYHPPTVGYPDPWIFVSEVRVYDGYAIQVTFSASLPVFASAHASARESVEVNATPAIGIYTANEVMELAPAE